MPYGNNDTVNLQGESKGQGSWRKVAKCNWNKQNGVCISGDCKREVDENGKEVNYGKGKMSTKS